MGFHNSKVIKKSRKDHICDICSLKIPKGFSYTAGAGMYEGDFYSRRNHNECLAEYFEQNKDSHHWEDCVELCEIQDFDFIAHRKMIIKQYNLA